MHKTYPHLLLLLSVVAYTVFNGTRMTFNSLLIHKTADVGLYRPSKAYSFLCTFHNVWCFSSGRILLWTPYAYRGFALNPFAENPPKNPWISEKGSNSVSKPFADRKPQ